MTQNNAALQMFEQVKIIFQNEMNEMNIDKKIRKILLVEDNPSNVLVTSVFLENLGYDFDIARNGEEALKKVGEKFYDVVLMDVSMPGMDGFSATKKIRAMESKGILSPIRIIAMTAHALIDDRQKCLDAGMNDYISKPFSQECLQSKIEQNLIKSVVYAD
jgi:CheY-like chemotaxis protein